MREGRLPRATFVCPPRFRLAEERFAQGRGRCLAAERERPASGGGGGGGLFPPGRADFSVSLWAAGQVDSRRSPEEAAATASKFRQVTQSCRCGSRQGKRSRTSRPCALTEKKFRRTQAAAAAASLFRRSSKISRPESTERALERHGALLQAGALRRTEKRTLLVQFF